jgi:hypothetical protein
MEKNLEARRARMANQRWVNRFMWIEIVSGQIETPKDYMEVSADSVFGLDGRFFSWHLGFQSKLKTVKYWAGFGRIWLVSVDFVP